MTRLDEMFSDALQREATTPSGEQRAAVTEVTIHRARRHRRARAAVEVVAALVVVAAGFVVGATVLGGTATPPISTPTPTAPVATVTAPPDLISVLDPRLAPAPAMEAGDWAKVTFAWDAELASFIGGGKDGYGSVLAIYLTPPGGSRMLAYSNSTTFVSAPVLLGFDPTTRSVILSGSYTGTIRMLNLETGVAREVDLNLFEPTSGVAPLGKLSNGDSLFMVSTVDSHSDFTAHVFRAFDGTAVPVTEGRFDVSPVWGDRLVVIDHGTFTFLDADGTPPQSIDGAEGCGFAVWNTDGSFIARCGETLDRTGDYVRVDPESGVVTKVWEDSAYADDAGPPDALTEFQALDTARAWSTGTFTGRVPYMPPAIYSDGVKVADLADGFGETPKSYGIIFGVGR